jgi:hypothetical protein
MAKSWFRFSLQDDLTGNSSSARNASASHPVAVQEDTEAAPEVPAPEEKIAPPVAVEQSSFQSFEQIYSHATVKPPRLSYGILKISDMSNSPHLAGMSQEARRSALLMALEAAGVELEDLLQDAVVRQRALNDYEEIQEKQLKDIEEAKAAENSRIQAELDKLTSQYLGRIQKNLDEVARAQDRFRAWQKRKEEESQKITDAATYCVPPGSLAGGNSLATVLERAARR